MDNVYFSDMETTNRNNTDEARGMSFEDASQKLGGLLGENAEGSVSNQPFTASHPEMVDEGMLKAEGNTPNQPSSSTSPEALTTINLISAHTKVNS